MMYLAERLHINMYNAFLKIYEDNINDIEAKIDQIQGISELPQRLVEFENTLEVMLPNPSLIFVFLWMFIINKKVFLKPFKRL